MNINLNFTKATYVQSWGSLPYSPLTFWDFSDKWRNQIHQKLFAIFALAKILNSTPQWQTISPFLAKILNRTSRRQKWRKYSDRKIQTFSDKWRMAMIPNHFSRYFETYLHDLCYECFLVELSQELRNYDRIISRSN